MIADLIGEAQVTDALWIGGSLLVGAIVGAWHAGRAMRELKSPGARALDAIEAELAEQVQP